MLNPLETEMLTALETVLRAYKSYGALARRDSEEYVSLTASGRAIKLGHTSHTSSVSSA